MISHIQRGKLQRITSSASGQALIELAFILPLLLLLLLGAIEIGRYAYMSILIGNAARAGAAYGAQSPPQSGDTAGIDAAAEYDFAGGTGTAAAANGPNETQLNVSSTFSCGCDSAGSITPSPIGTNATCFLTGASSCSSGGHWVIVVSVTASGTFNSLFSYPGIPSSISISRTANMRVAQN